MKMILLFTSDKFNEKDRKRLSNATKLANLHSAINARFSVLSILAKSILQKPMDMPLLKVKKLNNKIKKESGFSFSFVRHPYTR
jgi:hypothetical protein